MKTIQQQIIDFVDQNEFVTFKQLQDRFDGKVQLAVYLNAFQELLEVGGIVQVVDNKNLGTYKYRLPA